jgi:hypothetical protein
MKQYLEYMEFWRVYALLGLSVAMFGLSGCNTTLTPQQTAALVCIAASTGAIIAGESPKIQADGSAICNAGEQVATVLQPAATVQ